MPSSKTKSTIEEKYNNIPVLEAAGCNLTNELGYRAVYDPHNLENSTMFPMPDHFLGADSDRHKTRCFFLIDPSLPCQVRPKDWIKVRSTADRLPRDSIKKLKEVMLSGPGTQEKKACFEFKIRSSDLRLLGGFVEVEREERVGEEEEEIQYQILVFNTPTGKQRDGKTSIPKQFARALRFPRSSQAALEEEARTVASQLSHSATPQRTQEDEVEKEVDASQDALALEEISRGDVVTPHQNPPCTIEAVRAIVSETKQAVLKTLQEQTQQIQALSEKYTAQTTQLATHPFADKEKASKEEQSILVHTILHFVRDMEAFLATQQNLGTAEKYVGSVIAAMTKKGTAFYVQMLKHPQAKKYALPPAVAKYIGGYVEEHPVLWQIRNHLALASALQYFLENSECAAIAQRYLSDPVSEAHFTLPECASFEVAAEEVSVYFSAIEAEMESEETPLQAEKRVEIQASMYAVRQEIPCVDKRSLAILHILQESAEQMRSLSMQVEAQAEQLVRYDLAAQQTEEAQKELARTVLLFVKGVLCYLQTQPKNTWVTNLPAGLVGEVIEAISKGPAAYQALLDHRCTPPLAECIREHVKKNPNLWQLSGHYHVDFVRKQIDALYNKECIALERQFPEVLIQKGWLPSHLIRTANRMHAAEEREEKEEKSEEGDAASTGGIAEAGIACQVFQLPPVSADAMQREEGGEIACIAKRLAIYGGSVVASDLDGGGAPSVARYAARASAGLMQQGKQYQAVIWLNATQVGKNVHTHCLGMQYILLAEAWCGLKKPTTEEAIKAVYDYLQHKNTLLVFDNAANSQTIAPYLPARPRNIHVLITSPHAEWECMQPLRLDAYLPEEAPEIHPNRQEVVCPHCTSGTASTEQVEQCIEEVFQIFSQERKWKRAEELGQAITPHSLAMHQHLDAILGHYDPYRFEEKILRRHAIQFTQVGEYYLQLGQPEKAGLAFQQAWDIKEGRLKETPEKGYKLLVQLGLAHSRSKNFDEAISHLKRALKIKEKIQGKKPDDEEILSILTELSDTYDAKVLDVPILASAEKVEIEKGLPLSGEKEREHASHQLECLSRMAEIQRKCNYRERLALTLVKLVDVYADLSTTPPAEFHDYYLDMAKKALSELETIQKASSAPPDDKERVPALLARAKIYGLLGRDRSEQEKHLCFALRIQEQCYGLHHEKLVPILLALANLPRIKQPYQKAAVFLERAVDIQKKQPSYQGQKKLLEIFTLQRRLLCAETTLSAPEKRAIEQSLLERALIIEERMSDTIWMRIEIVNALKDLGNVYARSGNFVKQQHCLKSALTIYQETFDLTQESTQKHIRFVGLLVSLARAYHSLGQKKEALHAAQRTYATLLLQPHYYTAGEVQDYANAFREDYGFTLAELQGKAASPIQRTTLPSVVDSQSGLFANTGAVPAESQKKKKKKAQKVPEIQQHVQESLSSGKG